MTNFILMSINRISGWYKIYNDNDLAKTTFPAIPSGFSWVLIVDSQMINYFKNPNFLEEKGAMFLILSLGFVQWILKKTNKQCGMLVEIKWINTWNHIPEIEWINTRKHILPATSVDMV